jgi:diamine N-acetyltransferase
VRASEGQLRFVADFEPVALVILAKAFVRVGALDWWPLVIEDAGTTLGVVALVDERRQHAQLALFHLLVDRDHQRRGHGRAAVQALVALARQDDQCDRLRLTVHPENHAALALYRSEGFTVDGVDADGELRLSTRTATEGGALR